MVDGLAISESGSENFPKLKKALMGSFFMRQNIRSCGI